MINTRLKLYGCILVFCLLIAQSIGVQPATAFHITESEISKYIIISEENRFVRGGHEITCVLEKDKYGAEYKNLYMDLCSTSANLKSAKDWDNDLKRMEDYNTLKSINEKAIKDKQASSSQRISEDEVKADRSKKIEMFGEVFTLDKIVVYFIETIYICAAIIMLFTIIHVSSKHGFKEGFSTFVMFVIGVLLYVGSNLFGKSIPDLIFNSVVLLDSIAFSILGWAVPSLLGLAVAMYLVHASTDNIIWFRIFIMIVTFIFLMLGHLLLLKPEDKAALLPNFLFILTLGLYWGICKKWHNN